MLNYPEILDVMHRVRSAAMVAKHAWREELFANTLTYMNMTAYAPETKEIDASFT
jgi:hypothetical protein